MGVLGYLQLYNTVIHQTQFKRGKLSSRFSICAIINFIQKADFADMRMTFTE